MGRYDKYRTSREGGPQTNQTAFGRSQNYLLVCAQTGLLILIL